ncbi:MAG: FtsQ-type POTRA domain-containing protein [Clostridia bacterium]|nr:FtsQ-type POTRA domain-containing protein [Clostridia bacterium]
MKRITGKKPKENKKKKKVSMKLIVIGFIVVIIIGFLAIRILPTVRSIDVEIQVSDIEKGEDARITKEQVLTLANIKVGDKLYKERRSEIEKRIEENPYIQDAKLERNLSGKVKIQISQRKPTYMINYAGEYIYIDSEGYILEVNTNHNGTPIMIGLTTDFSELSIGNSKIRLNQNDLEKLDTVNNIISTIRSNNIENVITSIDVTDKKNFILHLDNDGKEVYLGDGSDMNTKVLYMKKILESEAGNTGIIYINGNLDEGYVYFREQ